MKELDWYGLYSGGWRKEITDLSYSHPAKYSRLLIKRIYDYALTQGYFKYGDVILDPFGGVGLGAADALRHGLHFIGVELEQPFVDMGAGCDCTGISPDDWMRFYGRWDRARYLNGRHWCPQCVNEASAILNEAPAPPVSQAQAVRRERIAELCILKKQRVPKYDPLPLPDDGYAPRHKQLPIFGAVDSPSYERNSGRIPRTSPHHYTGNLELFARRYARDGATAVLVQGDSRELGEVLADGIVSSPPYAKSLSTERHGIDWSKAKKDYPGRVMHSERTGMLDRHHNERQYGSGSANLGNLPATDAQFNAVVGSPPYQGSMNSPEKCGIDWEKAGRPDRARPSSKRISPQVDGNMAYGETDGQLGAMPEGSHAAVIGSPPYAESLASDDPDKRGGLYRDPKRRSDKTLTAEYGGSEGQLGGMRVISSPGYSGSELSTDKKFAEKVAQDRRGGSHLDLSAGCYESDGNVSRMQQGDFWQAARQIMEQVAMVLEPGAVAIWVVKGFVRSGKYVNFPEQWKQLGEACGFKTLKWIRAWLIEDKGAQYTLGGELEEREIQRKSFFRRLAESKGSPPVDFEVVLVQRRMA